MTWHGRVSLIENHEGHVNLMVDGVVVASFPFRENHFRVYPQSLAELEIDGWMMGYGEQFYPFKDGGRVRNVVKKED